MSDTPSPESIAIIGIAGRFPMAANVDEFWANLVSGRDCFREFSVDELVAAGLPRDIASAPNYVRRSPVLEKPAEFDAHLFGFSPKEAEYIDPQHRLLMECAWEVLEQAGHDPHRFDGAIGIWAGCGPSNYFFKNILSHAGHFEALSNFNTIVGNDKDYLVSRIAYKFNLRGPAVVVQSACSTSLVAVHNACQALLTYQCDMALAGGVSLQFPRAPGYVFSEGEIFSPDGVVRTFDKGANGTVLGEGCGIIALRRLEDAIASGDRILAVVRGSAINNDGSARAGFTAPGVAGQSELIAMAQAVAGVEARDIGYVETHGTGTSLGDPIEVAALTKAFRQTTDERGFCGLGTVKPNIGHLDVAAGIAGLIKTICALQHRQLPGTLHFTSPNPELGLETSPFYIVDRLMDWKPRNGRRIAGVSSFGLGGTNAHIVLEEYSAPATPTTAATSLGWHLLPVSAATETALKKTCDNLATELSNRSDTLALADVQLTLATGRQVLQHRACIVAQSVQEAAAALKKPNDRLTAHGKAGRSERPVVFMFSGQGTQYHGMSHGLFQQQPVFRRNIEACAEIIGPISGVSSLLEILYPTIEEQGKLINQTAVSQPALFAVEYALAQLWKSVGVKPVAVLGHSIGEYVAACEAGVFSLKDALSLVRERARLMQSMATGAMIAVPRAEAEIRPLLPTTLDIAVINGPTISVISGPVNEIDAFAKLLSERGIDTRRLQTSHAFHSRMMEEAAQKFTEVVARVTRNAPNLPLLSNVSGTWMTDEQVVDPSYWANHLRNTVRFGDNLAAVAKRFDSALLLEIGPGNTLCSIARQQPDAVSALPSTPSIRHPQQKVDDIAYFTRAFGALWCHGAGVDIRTLQVDSINRRVTLPTYPFERKELYIAARPRQSTNDATPHHFNLRFPWSRSKSQSSTEATAKPDPGETATQEITLEALINIWKEVLGATVVGPDDNFFDLGGHSLLAVSLVNRIQKTFGQKLPLAALLNAPTPRQNLRQLSDSCRTSSSRALVPIIKQGSRTPIFLFHSHGGNVLEYYRLATLLGIDRPVYAIQCHGADGGPLLPVPIEEMTRMYLEEIQAVQPNGPYFLGGYCFGGILAIEAALQLRAAGQETALVFMINAVTHTYPVNLRPNLSLAHRIFGKILDRLQLEYANFAGRSMHDQLRQFHNRVNRMRDLAMVKFENLSAKFRTRLHTPPKTQSLTHHLEQLATNNDMSWLRYRPRPYDGRVLAFRASKQPREIQPDPLLGWTKFLTGNATQKDINGFRQTLLDDPCVVEIADVINSELNH